MEIAAQELDMREELEEAAINLNVTHTQDGLSTQLQRKRIVKPGKAARSPFVLGYDPPVRASADGEKVFRMFTKEPTNARNDEEVPANGLCFAFDKGKGCWRHWIEPDFVNHVSRGDVITSVRYIQDMFIGEHIKYDVHRCTENDGVLHSKMNILVDVLGLERNIGHLPERYRKCLVRNKVYA
ncbi:hypothetical protein D1007_25368 [Hordeum vulgare]|nr:hypothetical protein D1007_25368 [Hordeum vulgare]